MCPAPRTREMSRAFDAKTKGTYEPDERKTNLSTVAWDWSRNLQKRSGNSDFFSAKISRKRAARELEGSELSGVVGLSVEGARRFPAAGSVGRAR